MAGANSGPIRPGAIASHTVIPFLAEFATVVSFALRATLDPDDATITRMTAGPANAMLPAQPSAYVRGWSEHHKHIVPTSVELPDWGGIVVPYRWMLKESGWEMAADWGLAVDPGREPTRDAFPSFMVDTPWIQDCENQCVMLDGFADQLAPRQGAQADDSRASDPRGGRGD